MNTRAFFLGMWGVAAVLWSALLCSRAICDQAVATISVDTVVSPEAAVLDSASADSTTAASPSAPRDDSATSETPRPAFSSNCVAVNTADRGELESLPGIGPVIADRILALRRLDGPFEKPEDLRRVKGIGPARLDKIRDLVCF